MKKLITVLLCICFTMTLAAQNEKGQFSIKPMAGVNISTFGSPTFDVYKTTYKFTGGAEIEYGINPWLGASLGVIYSQQGAKIEGAMALYGEDDKGKLINYSTMIGKLNCNYLNLPLLANIYLPIIKGLSLKAGLQVGILTGDKNKMDTQTAVIRAIEDDYVIKEPTHNPDEGIIGLSYTLTDVCKTFDFGIPIGISYEYKNISLDARYYFGLTKIDKTEDPDNARNRYLSITLGYRLKL